MIISLGWMMFLIKWTDGESHFLTTTSFIMDRERMWVFGPGPSSNHFDIDDECPQTFKPSQS